VTGGERYEAGDNRDTTNCGEGLLELHVKLRRRLREVRLSSRRYSRQSTAYEQMAIRKVVIS
jgi:hypothetical protein